MAFTLFDNPHLVTDDKELVAEVAKTPRKTTRNIFLRTYEPKEVIDLWLRETHPTEWAMVYHDKDTLKDGSPKEPHWHVIASWKKPASPSRYKYLTKFFGKSDQQTFIEHAMNLRSATEYLWHKNSPDKYQYRQEDLISFGLDRLLETKKDENERNNETFIDDLSSLSRYELGVKYGRDYIKNMRRYEDFVAAKNWDEVSAELCAVVADIRENCICHARAEALAVKITHFLLTNADPSLPNFAAQLSVMLAEVMEGAI